MRPTRKQPSRFMVEITWYPGGDERVDFVFHRRTAVTPAEMDRQRQAGVRNPSQHTNIVIGADSCAPTTMEAVRDHAYTWLEEHEGADRERDSFVFQNWTSRDQGLVASRVGATQAD